MCSAGEMVILSFRSTGFDFEMEELKYLNALNRIRLLGPVRMGLLLNYFGSAKAAWNAPEMSWAEIPALRNIVPGLVGERNLIDPEKEWLRLQNMGHGVWGLNSPEYPALLKTISRPPPVLYICGRGPADDQPTVAIVGSRRCTSYGREIAARLAVQLAGLGIVVVSGLALGIDTQAHRGALKASGRTVAVLGCGLNIDYPFRNRDLRDRIASSGMIMSEFPLDMPPLPQNFPQRNRIISGLSLGTVVVEAPDKSGALITANFALEQNREVFAVPGNIDSPYSRGCHRLIRDGAKLVETVADILDELPVSSVNRETRKEKTEPDLSLPEQDLLELVPYRPEHIDQIIRSSGLPAQTVSAGLLNLELKGFLRQLPGKYFIRV